MSEIPPHYLWRRLGALFGRVLRMRERREQSTDWRVVRPPIGRIGGAVRDRPTPGYGLVSVLGLGDARCCVEVQTGLVKPDGRAGRPVPRFGPRAMAVALCGADFAG